MKQKIPPGVVVAVIVVVLAGVAYFGWYYMSGGRNGDVTAQTINHWQEMKNQALAHKMNSPAAAAKAGAPMAGAPAGGAPMSAPGTAPMGRTQMGGAPFAGGGGR